MREYLEAGGGPTEMLLRMATEHEAHAAMLTPAAALGPYLTDVLDEAEIEAERWAAAPARCRRASARRVPCTARSFVSGCWSWPA